MPLYSFLISSSIGLLAFRSFNIVLIWSIISTEQENGLILGTVIAIMWVFNLIFLPISGELLDTKDKKKILHLNSIVAILAISVFYLNTIYLENGIIVSALCASILAANNSISSSGINSIIPFIAKKESYTKAIGIATTFNSFQTIIGAFLGGGFIAIWGVQGAIIIVITLYSISYLLVHLIKIKKVTTSERNLKDNNLTQRMMIGFKVLSKLSAEKHICYTSMISNFIITPLLTVAIPFYIVEKIGNNVNTLAIFEASFASGMLLGGIIISKVDFNIYKRIVPVFFGNILIGFGILLFVYVEPTAFKALSLAISGFGLTTKSVACSSIRTLAVPDIYRARLESAVFFLCIISIPVGSQLFGYFTSIAGAEHINSIIIVMGLVIIMTSIIFLVSKEVLSILKKKDTELDQLYIKKYPTAFEN